MEVSFWKQNIPSKARLPAVCVSSQSFRVAQAPELLRFTGPEKVTPLNGIRLFFRTEGVGSQQ
jgi:hypothetical protein